ncbi:hypothetical protein C1645_593501 [Glomus cerebriforme]|uniref:Uncharacterized protein n=1 Tax=Glomus cerebriforme TaxID=658196 RepID=A0A397T6R3_9GLOM|nr:hypothetical protein C1645_593501 [Glomus cerebriforme]
MSKMFILRNKLRKGYKKTVKPTRTNRTVQVKTAYPRIFNPTSSNPKQLNFIKNKNECFRYGYDLKKNIQLSFCSTCNSSYQRLSSKNSNTSNKSNLTEGTEATEATDIAKIIDLEATSSEVSTTIIQSESKCNNSETENESDAELELEVNYKLVIKQADVPFFQLRTTQLQSLSCDDRCCDYGYDCEVTIQDNKDKHLVMEYVEYNVDNSLKIYYYVSIYYYLLVKLILI